MKQKRIKDTDPHFVTEPLGYALDKYDLEGPLDKVIEKLQSIPEAYPDYSDFEICMEEHGDYGYGGIEVFVRATRPETEGERTKRISKAIKARERAKETRRIEKEQKGKEEREAYERLKKKFEN